MSIDSTILGQLSREVESLQKNMQIVNENIKNSHFLLLQEMSAGLMKTNLMVNFLLKIVKEKFEYSEELIEKEYREFLKIEEKKIPDELKNRISIPEEDPKEEENNSGC